MCGKANTSRHVIEPGSFLIINKKEGNTDSLIWAPQPYNARVESLNSYWKSYQRGYVTLTSFWEGIGLFTVNGSSKFGGWEIYPLVVYNEHGFAMVTKESKGTIIQPYHHRMPVLLEKPIDLITTGKIVEIDYSRLFQIA